MIYPTIRIEVIKMKKALLLRIAFVVWTIFLTTGAATAQVRVVSPIQNMYYHISDDDGTKPTEGTDVILLFEPSREALVYVQSLEDQIANKGNWSYEQGKLSLQFDAEALKVNTTFGLDLEQDEIEMPFRLFSSERGSSKWKRHPVVVEHAVRFIFRGGGPQ